MDNVSFNNKGFTLVEVVAVIAILGVIAGIAVLSVGEIIENAREDACNVNSLQLERKYEEYLALESLDHSEAAFMQFKHDYNANICPEDGVISYVDGEVQCSVHDGTDAQDSDEGDGVPYL